MMPFHLKLSRKLKKELESQLSRSRNGGKLQEMERLLAITSIAEGYTPSQVSGILQHSASAVYKWIRLFLVKGIKGLLDKSKAGRPAKLTKKQKKQLSKWIECGPEACGFSGGCWRTPMIQELVFREFGVLYSVGYLSELLKNLGFTYQKARFVSASQDEKARKSWLEKIWPKILAEAKRRNSHLMFEDESSFPQWGTLNYTWAKRGEQPLVKSSGKKKSYRLFGMIEYFTGKFFAKGHEGKLNVQSYQEYLTEVMAKTRKHIILIHDGAPYHTCPRMQEFFHRHADKLTVYQLPGYSPDYNPIEGLWKKIKQHGTHLKYFPTFESLVDKVDEMVVKFKSLQKEILALFGLYDKLGFAC